jgi:hypothetical protein
MRISTTFKISSVMLMPKKLEIRKKNLKTKRADKNQNEINKIEPNPSKDRAMHEGDNPSF